jgi:glycosyltransferase involved in cell wall biosynthesis
LHIVFGNTGTQLLPFLRDPRRRMPAIVSFHGADVLVDLDRPAHRRAFTELCGQVALVLARSRSLLDTLARHGCPPEKLRLNRTGIPLEAFPYQQRTPPAADAFRLFQACRLIPKKGLRTSISAFARFAATYPNARLTIAGEGPLEPELRALCAQCGIADRVEFAGFLTQDELRERLYASDLFLHPSELGSDGNQEGVPNSLLEAMSTGLPVFATTHGGIPEAVEHGVSGWLVPEGDHAALGEALCRFAGDPEGLVAMGRAGAEAVRVNFDLAAQARKLEDYYLEAIAMADQGGDEHTVGG